MPLRVDGLLISFLIALTMIGALAGVLRWTFSGRSRSSAPTAPPATADRATLDPPKADPATTDPATTDPPTATAPDVDAPDPPPAISDDFGLLGTVAVVESMEDAQRLRSRLRVAGIRATTARGRDGRLRVLVFEAELHRARRVTGWPT